MLVPPLLYTVTQLWSSPIPRFILDGIKLAGDKSGTKAGYGDPAHPYRPGVADYHYFFLPSLPLSSLLPLPSFLPPSLPLLSHSLALWGMCLHGKGQHHLVVGQDSEAAEAFTKALEIAEEVYGNTHIQVCVNQSYGVIYDCAT